MRPESRMFCSMARKLIAKTGGLTQREHQFFSAIVGVYKMLLYTQLTAKHGAAADTPKTEDAITEAAAKWLATHFPDLGIAVVEEGTLLEPDVKVWN
jgi:hypothetical protein